MLGLELPTANCCWAMHWVGNVARPLWRDVNKETLQTSIVMNYFNSSVARNKMADIATMVMDEWQRSSSGTDKLVRASRRKRDSGHAPWCCVTLRKLRAAMILQINLYQCFSNRVLQNTVRGSARYSEINTKLFWNTANSYKYASKYRENFCPAVENSGVISVR